MFGFFSISTEIFLVLQVLFLLILSVILNEKILLLKYKYNILNFLLLFTILLFFYSIVILTSSFYYESILLNYQLIMDSLSFYLKFLTLFMAVLCILLSLNYNKYEKIKVFEYILLFPFSPSPLK